MKISTLSLLLILATASIFIDNHAMTSVQLEEMRKQKELGLPSVKEKFFKARHALELLLQDARQPSAKLAEKIKEITDKRDKKLTELRSEKVREKMDWGKYSKKKRKIIKH